MNKLLLILPLIILISFSCVTSKSLSKKATVLDEAGEYTAAADLFYQSIQKNSQNTTAIIGLKRTGTKVLNDYLKKFSQYSIQEQYEKATYAYLDAVIYQTKLKGVNVIVEIPYSAQDNYKNVLNQYLTTKYDNGLKLIEIEEFDDAEKCFNEVYKFDESFKDVAELRNIAYLEPYYRKAEEYKTQKQYRDAYNSYLVILDRVGNYKQTKEHLELVLVKGRIYITMSSDEQNRYSRYSKSIKQQVINSIVKINDPFIKIVDREDIDKVIKEQELILSGLSSNDIEIGEIAGAQYNVVIDVINYSVSVSPLKKEKIKGLESYKEKYKDSEGKQRTRTKYTNVYYYEYRSTRTLVMSVSYRIVSLSTSEIIATDIIKSSLNSKVHYATYSGIKKQLYPPANKNGYVGNGYRALQNLLAADRDLKPAAILVEEFNNYSGNSIANSIVTKLK
ncbi:MAG: hypothetical protein DRI86_11575 [Bacteroidetes bacterium]|nr:MAG: hypothetical protein DRI86_11575 [Bacteroidota bacterium]